MRRLCLLLSPKLRGLRNQFIRPGQSGRKKAALMGGIGLLFLVALFVLSCRVLGYFRSIEMIGDLLAHHLLGMILLTLFSLLIFSHIITALSTLYLSRDLEFCHSTPLEIETVFVSRALTTVLSSSWMLIVFGLPVFLAYAWVYRPGVLFYFGLIHLNLAMMGIAGGIGILVTMVLVAIFPAQKTRDIVLLLVIFMLGGLYVLFRLLRPERLVDPDAFFSIMQYLSALKGADSPYLPTYWITEALWGALNGHGSRHFLEVGMAWSTACTIAVINIWTARAIYFSGFSKSQEAKRRRLMGDPSAGLLMRCLGAVFGRDLAGCLVKDIRTFFRDNTQWSQLLLLGALVVVYVFNFKALPLDKSPIRLDFLQNEIAFFNMALAAFVLSAVSARFVFPAVSGEGEAYWILRTSPLSLHRLLLGKYFFFLIPMLLLAETLVVFTNTLLEVTPFMMTLSTVTMLFLVFGIVSLGIGFGAIYPNFRFENIAQVSTGFGGVIFMILSALFIAAVIVLEAGPVYLLFMADVRGTAISPMQWFFIALSFMAVLVVNGVATYVPLRIGIKALETKEI